MSLCKTISKAATVLSWLSEHALNIFSLSDMFFLTLVSGVSSSTSWPTTMGTCAGSFDSLIPEMDCKILFLVHGRLCHVAVRLAFSSTDLEQTFALMWRRSRKKISRTFVPLSELLQRRGTVRTFQHCELRANILARAALSFPRRHSEELDPLRC